MTDNSNNKDTAASKDTTPDKVVESDEKSSVPANPNALTKPAATAASEAVYFSDYAVLNLETNETILASSDISLDEWDLLLSSGQGPLGFRGASGGGSDGGGGGSCGGGGTDASDAGCSDSTSK